MKYKAGDRVRVRSDLVVRQKYGNKGHKDVCFFVETMKHLEGRVVTIRAVEEKHEKGGRYRLEGDVHYWVDGMFEDTLYKPGDRVRVIKNPERHTSYYMRGEDYADTMVDEMISLAGKVVTIESVGIKYKIEGMFDLNWTDEMFEGLADEEQEWEVVFEGPASELPTETTIEATAETDPTAISPEEAYFWSLVI